MKSFVDSTFDFNASNVNERMHVWIVCTMAIVITLHNRRRQIRWIIDRFLMDLCHFVSKSVRLSAIVLISLSFSHVGVVKDCLKLLSTALDI